MSKESYKIFNDPVHGTIQLHPFLVKIIDTPEFQRLRNIKQLGAAYFVYPGAQHNRFEHSIGTAYLAGKLVRHLKKEIEESIDDKESEELIDDKDVLCVEIAGLCHDLGHGPFSHLFDAVIGASKQEKGKEWTHEKQSCFLVDKLMKDLESEWKKEGITESDVVFIKEMIDPPNEKDGEDWPYKGRPKTKRFFYDIISNKDSGVDVDKWDYFARDCHHLGISNGFDHNRFIQFTKVLRVGPRDEGKKRICVHKKEAFNLYEMFHTRYALHKRAYQHKVVVAIELMISDAMIEVDKNHEGFFKVPRTKKKRKISESDGFKIPRTEKTCKISECVGVDNLKAYRFLDDGILQMIRHSEDDCLEEARKLIERIWKRDLYKCVGEKIFSKAQDPEDKDKDRRIADEIAQLADPKFNNTDIAVVFVKFSYGKGKLDPIKYHHFYDKENDEEGKKGIDKNDVSSFLPENFKEVRVRVYCKHKKHEVAAKKAFDQWFEEEANKWKNANEKGTQTDVIEN